MNNTTGQNPQDNNLIQSITNFASFQPFVGLFSSVMYALFLLFKEKPWSWSMVAYTVIPFIGFIAIYAIIAVCVKIKYGIIILFINNKVKKLMIFLFLLLIGLNIALWKRNSTVEYVHVNLADLSSVEAEISESQKYYVMYGSENCIYCNQMEDIYQEAFLKDPKPYIYYVDLTNETIDSSLVKERNISQIPLLVYYQNNKEVDRIEGVAKLEKITTFLQK